MVVEDMRSTGLLGVPEEYFIPWDPEKEIDWMQQLDQIASKAASSNRTIAVKVMANQIATIDNCLKNSWKNREPVQSNNTLFPYFRKITESAKYVFIRRDNIVRQAISRGMSRQTGINHATGNSSDEHFAGNLMRGYESNYNSRVKYDQTKLEKDILQINNENLLWERYFEKWGISHPLVLRYEEICKNFPAYIERIGRYVDTEISSKDVERKMVKLSNAKNEEWLDKYVSSLMLS